ncbi:MAG TPA: glycosyltransferase [Bryobacteraceae bacterium]
MLLFATWVAYPLLLFCFRRAQNVEADGPRFRVTVLVTAHDAAKEIGRRVRNLAEQTYPPELLRIYVASDGSEDATVHTALNATPNAAWGRLTTKQFPRAGKSTTQNGAIAEISDEIIVLTDADTDFEADCIEQLVASFSDAKVGCVTGNVISKDMSRPLSKDQGLYWRFENRLRQSESDAGILITASGPCMAFRRELFRPLTPSRGDDCMIPLDVALQGHSIVHAPLAIAYDSFPSTLRGELRARARMTTRNLAGFFDRSVLLNPLRYPGYALSLWLHKIFRWMTPFFAVAFCLSSILRPRWFLLLPQLLFLMLAIVGGVFALAGRMAPRIAAFAFSFVVANVGFAWGVVQCFAGKEITSYTNIREGGDPTLRSPKPGSFPQPNADRGRQ